MTTITDDNDNLIEVEDEVTEWTKTPGGFCRIDIDLDDKVREDLINFWARDNLNEASLETYDELLAKGSQTDALYGAVLNDIIIQTLVEQIARSEAEAAAELDDKS